MDSQSRTWKAEVRCSAAGVRDRRLSQARDRNRRRLSRLKGRSLAWVFAVALAPAAASTICLASPPKAPNEVPFELYLGYTIVAKGSMGRLQKLNFIIDTGAVPSIVDRRVARKLGLEGVAESVSVFNKEIPVEEVMVPSVSIGPVAANSVRALVHDLGFLERGLGVRIDAMIGLDVLGGQDFSIDYATKRIAFELPTDETGSATADEPDVPFERGPGFVIVQIQIQGRPLRLMVDTGTNDLVLFAPKVQGRLAGARTVGVRMKTTLGGEARVPVVELADASLGSSELRGQRAVLLDGEGPASAGLDGLLGVMTLGVARITFDFEHNIFRWKRR
jgi:predicted aspartyl protease